MGLRWWWKKYKVWKSIIQASYITMRYSLTLLSLVFSLIISAQNKETKIIPQKIEYSSAATFFGGEDSLRRYISRRIVIPDSLNELSFVKKGLVKFTVKKDGTTGDFEILEKTFNCYDEAVIAAIRLTKWTPATENGIVTEEILRLPYTITND